MIERGAPLGAFLIAGGFVVFTIVGVLVEAAWGPILSIGGGLLMILGALEIRRHSAPGTRARTLATIAVALTWITLITGRIVTSMDRAPELSIEEIKRVVIVGGINDTLITLVGLLALFALAPLFERALLVTAVVISVVAMFYTLGAIDMILGGTLDYDEFSTVLDWLIVGSNVPVAVAGVLVGMKERKRATLAPTSVASAFAPEAAPCASCASPMLPTEGVCLRCGAAKTPAPPAS